MIAELREWLLITNVRAFLRVIRAGESSQDDDAYRMLFGGGLFQSYRDHPRIRFYEKNDEFIRNGKKDYTTAAGAYQITETTWNAIVKALGPMDFSPPSQDLAAVYLIKGRGALDDVIAGRFHAGVRKLGKEWASLPGSSWGQPTKTIHQAEAIYAQYNGTFAAEPKEVTPMAPIAIAAAQAFLPELLKLLPFLGGLFGSGSEVSNRNVAAVTGIANAVIKATETPNLQAAIEQMQTNPEALQAARQAVTEILPSITEAGSGGIAGAHKRNMEAAQIPLFSQAPFIMGLLFFLLIAFVTVAVMLKLSWIAEVTPETRAGVIMFVIGTFGGGLVGFYYGTSSGSQRKTELLGKS